MRVTIFICFAVTAILASPPTTRYAPFTAAMNFLTRQVPFPRIAGGDGSPVNALPYLVSLQALSSLPSHNWVHFCGGSVLSPTKIVTAAHCAQWITNPREWRVAAGKNDLWSPDDSGQYRFIKSVVIHPGYCKTCLETDNDVAIIEVSTPFDFNEFVNKIDLIEFEPKDGECVTSGWEIQTSEDPDPLRSYTIPVVPRDTCASKYPDGPHITSLDICAGDNGMGPCHGTGRPLVCDGALAGVASWTSFRFCNKPDRPTVFANVAVLQGWIKDQL